MDTLPLLPAAPPSLTCTPANAFRLLLVSLAASLFIFITISLSTHGVVSTLATSYLTWTRNNGAVAALTFSCVYAACVFFTVPAVLGMLGSGYVFTQAHGQALGVLLATLMVQLGAMAGGAAAFLAGRFLLRGFVAGLARKYLARWGHGGAGTAHREPAVAVAYFAMECCELAAGGHGAALPHLLHCLGGHAA